MGLSQAILERHRDVELIESAADEFEDEKETHDSRFSAESSPSSSPLKRGSRETEPTAILKKRQLGREPTPGPRENRKRISKEDA